MNMNRDEILKNPTAYTIINDGVFQYPVETTKIRQSGKRHADLKAMDGKQYAAWSDEVPQASDYAVGTQECIDVCEALSEAGADTWHIG